jgi:hypothetical protein
VQLVGGGNALIQIVELPPPAMPDDADVQVAGLGARGSY